MNAASDRHTRSALGSTARASRRCVRVSLRIEREAQVYIRYVLASQMTP